jgi:hypothetical protein
MDKLSATAPRRFQFRLLHLFALVTAVAVLAAVARVYPNFMLGLLVTLLVLAFGLTQAALMALVATVTFYFGVVLVVGIWQCLSGWLGWARSDNLPKKPCASGSA